MKHFTLKIGILIGTMAFAVSPLAAQFAEPSHPELKWLSAETEHFEIHFHEGTERTARVVAKIAEDVYEPITAIYDYRPSKKIHFIIRDHDDYSNGGAFYYDNKVEIWATPADFELRGSHNWLRNVVTHEFTHMIQLQASRKMTQKIPAFYLQWIHYEKEVRPDVLYGFPNGIISYPLPMTVMPSWFAEGVSQYQWPGLNYDTWDSHRDMLLRTAVLENKLLTLGQMSSFGKNSVGNERAYNQGFSLVSYIAEHYGLVSLRKASEAMQSFFRISFPQALKVATGKSGGELYAEWQAYLAEKYEYQTRDIRSHPIEGELIEKNGIGNFYPRWSPDGNRLAYLTNGGADYISLTSLVIRNFDAKGKKKLKAIKGGVRTPFDWSADGRWLIYAKKTDVSRHGSHFFDLYLYDLQKRKETRLTRDARAHSPAFSPDGKQVAFVVNYDGSQNLYLMDLQQRQMRKMTHYRDGEQVYQPRWFPDGKRILLARTQRSGRDILALDRESGEVAPLVANGHDNRDAIFSPDGQWLYFASDRTGIFNIYRRNLATGAEEQLTNVLGGAFMPAVNVKGELAFSKFVADGYKLARLDSLAPVPEQFTHYPDFTSKIQLASNTNGISPVNVNNIRSPEYDDSNPPELDSKPYQNSYGGFSFFPRLMIDYGTAKIGTYLYSHDMLDNFNVLGGFAINRDADWDLFALVDYRKLGPTLFIEAYNQTRNFSEANDKFKYNLTEVDLGIRTTLPYRPDHKLQASFVFSRYATKITSKLNKQITFSTNAVYFIGRAAQFSYTYDGVAPAIDMEANPRIGRRVHIDFRHEWNLFLRDFEVNENYGTLQEVYDSFSYNRIFVDWREYFSMPFRRHGVMLRLKAGYIDQPIHSFFNFFGGGIDGIRGYSYYSLEGRKLLQGTVAYRFPLLWQIDKSLTPFYFDKLFLGLFFDYGNAYSYKSVDFSRFKKAAGFQLRLDMFSFYGFPTKVFFDAAYGFDLIVNPNINSLVNGREWRYYFGITFGYLD